MKAAIARLAIVADDNEDARTLVADAARRVGFTVIEAVDGRELVASVRASWARAEDVAVVIADIGMPEIDGIDAIRQLLETEPELIAVIMTAFGDQATVKRARQAGALHVLRKPFPLASLEQVLIPIFTPATRPTA
jgi:CheY-like chemotaxis protein